MIKKKPFGDSLKEQLVASARDKLYSFILDDKNVRGAVVNGTRMVNEMRANHELGILETYVLGQAYLAAALLSSSIKGNDVVGIRVDCSGPIRGLVAEANAFGEVRGYLKNVPIPVDRPLESFDLSPFFGAGFLTVTRYLEDAKRPFSGNVSLEYGSLATDLANYFLLSEQLPTTINLSIQFDRDGTVKGAGGFLLQAMPGADRAVIDALAERTDALPSLGLAFAGENEPDAIVAEHFVDFSPKILGSHRVEFFCRCTKEQIQGILFSLPESERVDILANGPFPLEVSCHNCNTPYLFDRAALVSLFQEQ